MLRTTLRRARLLSPRAFQKTMWLVLIGGRVLCFAVGR
jgi:hypothetical protein